MSPSLSSPFLSLPRELRDAIYDALFQNLPSGTSCVPIAPSPGPVVRVRNVTYSPHLPSSLALPLYLTSRQIQAEAQDAVNRTIAANCISYVIKLDIEDETFILPTWLHLPILRPHLDSLDVCIVFSGCPQSATAPATEDEDDEAESALFWDGVLDVLDRFYRRGPDLTQVPMRKKLMHRRGKKIPNSAPWVKHPDYWSVEKLRIQIQIPNAATSTSITHARKVFKFIKKRIEYAWDKLLGDYDPGYASFHPTQYTGEVGKLLVLFECSDVIEVSVEGNAMQLKELGLDEHTHQWEMQRFQEEFKVYYLFEQQE